MNQSEDGDEEVTSGVCSLVKAQPLSFSGATGSLESGQVARAGHRNVVTFWSADAGLIWLTTRTILNIFIKFAKRYTLTLRIWPKYRNDQMYLVTLQR